MARGPLHCFARPLVSPPILFLIAHACLVDVAEDIADLLEEACDYVKIDTVRDLARFLPNCAVRDAENGRRIVLMPSLVNSREARVNVYSLFADKEIDYHYLGCIAITGVAEKLDTSRASNWECQKVLAKERVWLAPQFTLLLDATQDISPLKQFIVTALPLLI